mmetsp:Transcript_28963/g.70627  ORF Transcript_28963/g.70627 Transcript_28963/m.70627 type:complete len:668 (+) Transcript_28963:87-2090(+)
MLNFNSPAEATAALTLAGASLVELIMGFIILSRPDLFWGRLWYWISRIVARIVGAALNFKWLADGVKMRDSEKEGPPSDSKTYEKMKIQFLAGCQLISVAVIFFVDLTFPKSVDFPRLTSAFRMIQIIETVIRANVLIEHINYHHSWHENFHRMRTVIIWASFSLMLSTFIWALGPEHDVFCQFVSSDMHSANTIDVHDTGEHMHSANTSDANTSDVPDTEEHYPGQVSVILLLLVFGIGFNIDYFVATCQLLQHHLHSEARSNHSRSISRSRSPVRSIWSKNNERYRENSPKRSHSPSSSRVFYTRMKNKSSVDRKTDQTLIEVGEGERVYQKHKKSMSPRSQSAVLLSSPKSPRVESTSNNQIISWKSRMMSNIEAFLSKIAPFFDTTIGFIACISVLCATSIVFTGIRQCSSNNVNAPIFCWFQATPEVIAILVLVVRHIKDFKIGNRYQCFEFKQINGCVSVSSSWFWILPIILANVVTFSDMHTDNDFFRRPNSVNQLFDLILGLLAFCYIIRGLYVNEKDVWKILLCVSIFACWFGELMEELSHMHELLFHCGHHDYHEETVESIFLTPSWGASKISLISFTFRTEFYVAFMEMTVGLKKTGTFFKTINEMVTGLIGRQGRARSASLPARMHSLPKASASLNSRPSPKILDADEKNSMIIN